MAATTKFGKEIGKRLIDLEKPQIWLINEVRARTGLYFDDSYLYKIRTGQKATPKIVEAICSILDIPNVDSLLADNDTTPSDR